MHQVSLHTVMACYLVAYTTWHLVSRLCRRAWHRAAKQLTLGLGAGVLHIVTRAPHAVRDAPWHVDADRTKPVAAVAATAPNLCILGPSMLYNRVQLRRAGGDRNEHTTVCFVKFDPG